MTRFLASIGARHEIETALAGGADIIDLKDPSRGALAALDIDLIAEMLEAIAGRREVSAVTGDLMMEPELLRSRAAAVAATGVDLVKVGLHPDPRVKDCIRGLAEIARTTRLVGVMFADLNPDFGLVEAMAEADFSGAMLDTANKGEGRLTTHLGADELARFLATCRDNRLTCGLAGGLEAPDVPRLLALGPDVLGFRSALCGRHGRSGQLDPGAIALIRGLIPAEATTAVLRSTAGDGTVVDRIFVRDYVLRMEIGAYSHERGQQQRVSFDIAADIRRTPSDRDDLRQVFSYDVLTDAVRTVAAEGPFQLVETLAERIAARLLAHGAVVRVTVRVEKRDLGPGGVGVEIVRQRELAGGERQ